MELTELQMLSMIVVGIGFLGLNIFIIQTKKIEKKTKLKFTLFFTFTAYAICAFIDTQIYSSVPDMIRNIYI